VRQPSQRRYSIARAIQPVVQVLEQRRLLSATVTLDGLTSANLATGDATGVQQRPAVSFKGSSGVMAWTDDNASGGSGTDVVARRFDATGGWASDPFLVNTTTTGNQDSPTVATADDGSFVIACADGNNVRARRFDTAGSAVGANFTVSTDATVAKSDVAIR